jgi:hypothetical protein
VQELIILEGRRPLLVLLRPHWHALDLCHLLHEQLLHRGLVSQRCAVVCTVVILHHGAAVHPTSGTNQVTHLSRATKPRHH